MTVSSTIRRCALAIVVLSLLAFGLSSGGLGAAILGITLVIIGWSVTGGKNDWAAPKWAIAIMLAFVVARGVWTLTNRPATTIAPFLSFLASIMVVKCWERKTPRDIAQLLSIAAFVLIGSALGSNTFGIGVLIAIALPLLVHSAMMLQIDGARARVDRSPSVLLATSQTRGRPLLTSMSLVALGVALAAGVFVVVPRTQGSSAFAEFGLPGGRVSGFRDRMDLGRAGLISESQAVVLDVEVASGEGVPSVAGPEGQLYLRGAALESYNHQDGTWKRSTRFESEEPSDAIGIARSAPFTLTSSGSARDQVLLRVRDRERAGERRPVFAPWRAISVSQDSPERVALLPDRATGTASFVGVVPREYTIVCTTDPGGAADGPRTPVSDPDSPTVTLFARRVLDQAQLAADPRVRPISEDFRAVRALEQYLRENYTYTRELLAAPEGIWPVDWFLETSKEGHCEYFAGTLAALCRSIGINSRVVTGYVTGEYDSARRTYVVRQAGAHAWVEAEVGPGRWYQFDATPQEEISRLAGAEHGVMLQIERWLAGLESIWTTSIVDFGHEPNREEMLPGRASRLIIEWSQRIEEFIKRIGIVPIVTWSLIGLGVASLMLAGLGLLLKVVLRRVRPTRSQPGRAVKGEVAALYARMLKAWAKMGSPKPEWRGALEHARTLHGPSRELGEQVATLCYEAFFGEGALSRQSMERAGRAVATLEQTARERPSRLHA